MAENKIIGDVLPKFRVAAVQTTPVFLNREATINKVEAKVKEAKKQGAQLIVFPESFVPTFPYWAFNMAPNQQGALTRRLYANAVEVPGKAFNRLQEIARNNKVYLSIGVTEKSTVTIGTMWNTSLLFDPEGALIGHHRKIMPTFAEKLVWSFGDGSSLRTHKTELGNIGTLICGENSNTLAKYALGAQGEQVHISVYPACSLSFASADYAECLKARTIAHSFESKVYNICCSACIDQDALVQIAAGDKEMEKKLLNLPATVFGMTMVTEPSGHICSDILMNNKEGIIYADCDLTKALTPKSIHDIYGCYQRFDIFQLHVNRAHRVPVKFYNEDVEDKEFIPYVETEDV